MANIEERLNDRFLGRQYDEDELIEYLVENKYTEIEVKDTDSSREPDAKSSKRVHMKFFGKNRTLFVYIGASGEIIKVSMTEGSYVTQPKVEGVGFAIGCVTVVVIVVGLILWAVISGIIDNRNEIDSDCNDKYIEQDYNGDGEKDAEDFRIQTEACNQ